MTAPPATAPAQDGKGRARRWLRERFDDVVLQGVFAAMVVGAGSVLVMDYRELQARVADSALVAPGAPRTSGSPLPPARPSQDGAPPGRFDEALREAMTFDLAEGGRLIATGTIEPGTAEAFAAEIERRGSYVSTVVLHSPGGSVADALAMGELIRKRGFATEVEGNAYCASSCPLVFAGGVERRAGKKAAIGVHQVFAVSSEGLTVASGMDNAQRISARCQKHLAEMGVDLRVWMHAMETPKERLYYFSPDELIGLRLATWSGPPETEPEPPTAAAPAAPVPAPASL